MFPTGNGGTIARVTTETRRPPDGRPPRPLFPAADGAPPPTRIDGGTPPAAPAPIGVPIAPPAADPRLALLAAVDQAGDGLLLLAADWTVLHANAAAARLAGGSAASDGAAPTFWTVWPAARGTQVERRLRRAMAERGPARFEHRDVTPAVGDRWLEVVAVPVPDGLSVLLRDISAPKRTAEALRRADERFDLVAEVVDVALYDWDLDADVVTRSSGLAELLGYDPGDDAPAVDWWLTHVHPDDRPRVVADLRAALAEGDAFVSPCRARHKDGRYRQVLDRGRVVRDSAGRAIRVVGGTIDVTAREETEAALRASEERLRLALRHAPVVAFRQDRALRYTWVDNLSAVVWPESVLGRTDEDLLPAAEAAVVVPLKQGVMATGEVARRQVRATAPTGLRRYDLTVEPWRDGRGAIVGVTGTAVDVTDRAAAEDELRRRANLLDHAEDAIVAWDWPAGAITFWNRGAERLYGVPRADALGRLSHDLLATRDPESLGRVLRDLVRDGSWSGELEHLHRDGTPVPVETRLALVQDDGGSFVVQVNRDVAARKAVERTQEDFLAAASHDLRNPLGAVTGQTQLLRRRLKRPGPPDVDRLLAGIAAIDATAARMTTLIDELVDVARLRAGQPLDLRLGPVDLVALARQCVDRYGRASGRVRVEAEAPVVGVWDERRLERVLANLLTNALKYSPDGGEIVVRVARQTDERGAWAVVAVRDQGVGIPAAGLPHVFERYWRGANVGDIAGTGIGLAGARRIVEQHGGIIAVESDEGVGSTFSFRLPLDQEPA